MKNVFSQWQIWAALSAVFAAATAVLGKIGVADIDSSFATLIRTFVVLLASAAIVGLTHSYQPLATIAPDRGRADRRGHRACGGQGVAVPAGIRSSTARPGPLSLKAMAIWCSLAIAATRASPKP